jgi:hypothetical protein
VLLSIAADDTLALGSLYHWLRGTAAVTEHAELTPVPGTAGPTMNVLETVDVVLSNSVGLTSLLLAFAAWRRSGHRATVTLTVGATTVTLADADPATVAAIERSLRAAVDTDEHAA